MESYNYSVVSDRLQIIRSVAKNFRGTFLNINLSSASLPYILMVGLHNDYIFAKRKSYRETN